MNRNQPKCVCVCVRERERGRERVSECECVLKRVCVRVDLGACACERMSAKIVGALGEGGAGLWCGGLARYRGGSTVALNM